MKDAWHITAIFAFVIFALFGGPVRAENGKLYIYVKLCNGIQCVEKYLDVESDVNEIQCIYGSMGTVIEWSRTNMPSYRPIEWKCTHVRKQDI